MWNLLTEPLFQIEFVDGARRCSLPEAYAALIADRGESFPALRAHQEPAWHMFLVQLGAIAMHRAGLAEPPTDASQWHDIIRALTRDEFPDDGPWHLVVEDQSKPAFMQPPVPGGMTLGGEAPTPDALDMLITSRNHDLKQSVAAQAETDDWVFALVSMQTSEGFGGRSNYGIVRMNGGSSSRVMMGLAPMPAGSGDAAMRPGPRFRRDLTQLVLRHADLLERFPLGYPKQGGLALTWTAAWPDGQQLQLSGLDILFVEVCRRVRLLRNGSLIAAVTGISSAERIAGKQHKGVVGDPWAPVHRLDKKTLTIGDEGRFNFERVVELLSDEWELPLLAQLGAEETAQTTNWLLVLKAFARGNSKTGGFKERIIPITGRVARSLGPRRKELHQLASHQIAEIEKIDAVLRNALALASAGGERDEVGEANYTRTRPLRARLDQVADRIFFPALFERFEAELASDGPARSKSREDFIRTLVSAAEDLLKEGLADIPCASIRRPRAEARAWQTFRRQLRDERYGFPEFYALPLSDDRQAEDQNATEETTDAA